MLFNSLSFVIFFAAFLLAYRLSPPHARIPLLLVASLCFYTFWIPVYVLLLLLEIGVSWLLLRRIARGSRPRAVLALQIAFTLGLLAWYKYAVFAVESLAPVWQRLFQVDPALAEILLPLGISFYSFNILSLAIDTARGRAGPPPGLAHYALFIAFFPHLIAGPILRGPDFLPQLAHGERMTFERTRRGLWLIASGLAKKIVLGDFMLAPFVNQVFANAGVPSASVHWLALYAFAFQIYFDFSGYTDMARGLANLLGYELPANFLEPYLSRNPAEFWRRWHVTLSRWLRDYLYVPLGGNRHGRARTALNLLLTMLLGGLWHGAGWNFLVWGGLHGVLLVLHRAFGRGAGEEAPLHWRDAPKVVLCFHAVVLPWVFFRAESFAAAWTFLAAMFRVAGAQDVPPLPALVIVLCAALHALERWARPRLPGLRAALGDGPVAGLLEGVAFGVLVALALAAGGTGAEFIYFQF
jgi:alginate O-acetyltransferase complex protein AlgI